MLDTQMDPLRSPQSPYDQAFGLSTVGSGIDATKLREKGIDTPYADIKPQRAPSQANTLRDADATIPLFKGSPTYGSRPSIASANTWDSDEQALFLSYQIKMLIWLKGE
ncbi:uncharacterized protein ARMOST_04142 [Armillaria ostoyae]|uniref:Uncharacterized protein n=1 Tax=Armillaria ostoyae TaxID=47428 RepID=A0A284QWI0_ARMOS|nr:uncharacterized protein ARMOST_04142 [Armillaria ostoyae]